MYTANNFIAPFLSTSRTVRLLYPNGKISFTLIVCNYQKSSVSGNFLNIILEDATKEYKLEFVSNSEAKSAFISLKQAIDTLTPNCSGVIGGAVSPNGRFGIEDNYGIQTRSIGMQNYLLEVFDASTISFRTKTTNPLINTNFFINSEEVKLENLNLKIGEINNGLLLGKNNGKPFIKFSLPNGSVIFKPADLSNGSFDIVIPNYASGNVTLPLSVNGIVADVNGNINLAAAGNSDWNSTSGVGFILNKPNLALVATTGSYNDLINLPTLPTRASIRSLFAVTNIGTGNATYNSTTGVINIPSPVGSGGTGGTLNRFGIEDATSDVNRFIDFNNKNITLNNVNTFALSYSKNFTANKLELLALNIIDPTLGYKHDIYVNASTSSFSRSDGLANGAGGGLQQYIDSVYNNISLESHNTNSVNRQTFTLHQDKTVYENFANGSNIKVNFPRPLVTEQYFATSVNGNYADSTGNVSITGGGGGSAGIVTITYADLITAITGSTLVPGQQYLLSDYATIHYIVDGNGNQYTDTIITGVNEPLLVTASSNNTIDKEAKSALHPEDIIHYDPKPTKWLSDTSFSITGVQHITYISLSGRTGTGTANITIGTITRLMTFNTNLNTTTQDFVNSWASDYLAIGIAINNYGILYAVGVTTAIAPFEMSIQPLTGDLNGTVTLAQIGSAGGTLPNFKGVIYFRHDTVLDNYMGYDFRNVKFRRWKTNCTAWDSTTTFSKDSFINYSGFIYKSSKNTNINNIPPNQIDWWIPVLDLSLTEYWNSRSDNNNSIPSDSNSFIDVKTFAEGLNTATYERCCRANHFESFKDDYDNYDISGTLLSNNVFFLQDNNYYLVYSNQFGAENYNNTFGRYVYYNKIGNYFNSNTVLDGFTNNTIGNSFNNNTIGRNFYNNTIGNNYYNNTIGSYFLENNIGNSFAQNNINTSFNNNIIGNVFSSNSIGNYFSANTAASNFSNNTIGGSFQYNTAGSLFVGNTIGDGFQYSTVANYFANNILGNYSNYNTIGNYFNSNNIGDSFIYNNIENGFASNIAGNYFQYNNFLISSTYNINFTTATLVYQQHNKTIFKNSDNILRLSYYNASDVLTISNPTD